VIGVERRSEYVIWSREQLSMTAFEEVTMPDSCNDGIFRALLIALLPSPPLSEISF